jgi:hypothetical protein
LLNAPPKLFSAPSKFLAHPLKSEGCAKQSGGAL